ncbi:MAG: hypothetical protein Q7O66_07270 [Dehalococcoidia bacterium]|nr:hypothetical protein [Dehalococcoidia bacterium]
MRYSWRQTGYGQLPHILGSIALPKMTRLVTEDLYRRGFNSGCSVQVAESLLAADMGCSARTYIRHLNISEYVGFIRRRRLGEGNVNIIDLLLRPSDGQGAHMSAGILAQLPHLHPALFKDEQHTMEWWFVQVAWHKEAMRPIRGMVHRDGRMS